MAVLLLPSDDQSYTCYNRFHTFILNTQSKYFHLLCWITVKRTIAKLFDVSQQLLLILFSRGIYFHSHLDTYPHVFGKRVAFRNIQLGGIYIWGGKLKDLMFLHRFYINCLVSALQLSGLVSFCTFLLAYVLFWVWEYTCFIDLDVFFSNLTFEFRTVKFYLIPPLFSYFHLVKQAVG